MLAYIYLAIYFVATLVLLWGRQEVARFLAAHTTIADVEALEAFKRVARRNMLVTLPYAVMLIAGVGLGLHLLTQDPVRGLVLCIVANVIFFLVIRKIRPLEIRSRELPCPDPALAAEYARVSRSWLQRLWPDF